MPPTTNGITIEADNVSLDLNGHALLGNGFGSGHGIYQDTNRFHHAKVRNGIVAGWIGPDRSGIHLSGSNNHIELIRAYSNNLAILTGPNSLIMNCTVFSNQASNVGGGIFAASGSSVTKCSVFANAGFGSIAFGIFGGDGVTISQCTAFSNAFFSTSSIGISGSSGAVIRDCTVSGNVAQNNWNGIFALDGSTITGCSAHGNRTDGGTSSAISIGGGSRVEGNDTGIFLQNTHNLVIANRASSNITTNYNIALGNAYGPIVNVRGSNDVAAVTGAEHPLANLEY